MPDDSPVEYIDRNLATKTVFQYRDPKNGYDVKSKETYKKKKLIVHYPFNSRNGRQKYNSISEIRYEGIKEPLPAGFIKSPNRGYGFTRELAPILYELQDKLPSIKKITISATQETQLRGASEVIFSLADIQSARPRIVSVQDRHRAEQKTISNNILAELLPAKFISSKTKYIKGQLNELVKTYSLKVAALSEEDVESLFSIVNMIPSTHALVKSRELLSTKETIDRVFLEDIVTKYEKNLELKTDSKRLEDRWQEFFSDNILYFNFGYVERFEKERIQGDKTLNIPDFIMLNTFSYLDIFEIKTHLTQLLGYDKGRKNFYWTSEAAKAISQAENYIDSVISNEDSIIKNIRDEYDIHSVDAVRPQVFIIASCERHLAGIDCTIKYKGKVGKKLRNDFRRLNSSLKNIEFVLYDELLAVFKNTLSRLGTDAS